MSLNPRSQTARYKVNSLDRGLAILRAVRNADAPMRNQDVVASTGLPKATVSRLMLTLTAMGYLRRIDQGSYVLGHASGRSGRAMLDGLGLGRHAQLFRDIVGQTHAFAYLEARIADRIVPVYRWSAAGGVLLVSGPSSDASAIDSLAPVCFDFFFGGPAQVSHAGSEETVRQLSSAQWCHQWQAETERLSAFTGIRLESVGNFVLSLHVPQSVCPSGERLAVIRSQLLRAARAISSEANDRDSYASA